MATRWWKNFDDIFIHFGTTHERNGQTDRHRMPEIAVLMHRTGKITDRSFRYASPHRWNQLPDSFCQPRQSCLDSRLTSSVICQLISIITTTLIIHHSFTLSLQAQNLPFQQILSTLDFFHLPAGVSICLQHCEGPSSPLLTPLLPSLSLLSP